MIALGLTAADMKLFTASLSTHHSVKVTVQVLDLAHNYVGDLTSYLVDGQVNIDAGAEVTRSLTATFQDPDGRTHLDSTSPADGALYYDRMLRIIYSVKSAILPRWVDVPVFCGPITKMARTADQINVEAQGKESLVMPPVAAFTGHTYAKGWGRSQLVMSIMQTYGGETKFSIPSSTGTTPGPVVLQPETDIWSTVKAVNGSFATRQLFYDGRGVLVMRDTPRTSTYVFRTGVGGNVTTIPTIDFDLSEARNVSIVKGAIPKGKKTPVQATVGLPNTHPLNHLKMGRNGRPRVLLDAFSDDNLKTYEQARSVATARVNALGSQAVDVQFDALVVPHLEPMDLFTLQTPDFAVLARYTRATIPLTSPVGAVGYLTKAKPNAARIRRK